MKRTIIVLTTLALSIIGCTRDPDTLARRCSAARAAEAAYEALLAAGHTPSEGEVLAAAAIKAFIAFECAGVPRRGGIIPPPDAFHAPANRFQRSYNEWLLLEARSSSRGSGRLGDSRHPRGGYWHPGIIVSPNEP